MIDFQLDDVIWIIKPPTARSSAAFSQR